MDKRDRSALAKFRCGVAPIHVEIGRYNGVDLEDRVCTLCDQLEVEDEGHVLLRCDLYSDVRETLFNHCAEFIDFNSLDDCEKLCFILSNINIVRHSARVCRIILNRRKYFISK